MAALEIFALVVGLVFIEIALQEIPVSWNEPRVRRRARRVGRRRGLGEAEGLSIVRRQTRLGGLALSLFTLASVLVVAWMLTRGGLDDAAVLSLALVAGLALLTAAFLFLSPLLFDRVARRIEEDSKTANSPPGHPGAPHGPGP